MTYRLVKAIAMGTIGLSTGMVRFEPEHKDERYRFGVFTEDDAAKVIRKGLGEDVGEASNEDFASYIVLMTGDAPDPGRRLTEVLKTAKSGNDGDGSEAAAPKMSKTAAAAHLTAHPAGSRVNEGVDTVGVRELRDTLRVTSDLSALEAMLDAEKIGRNRDSAVKAIEARIRAVAPAMLTDAEEAQPAEGGAGIEGGAGEGAHVGGDAQTAAAEGAAEQSGATEADMTINAADAAPAAGENVAGTGSDNGGENVTADPDAAPA